MPQVVAFAGAIAATTIFGTSITVGQLALTLALSGASFLLNQTTQGSAAINQGQSATLQQAIYDERLVYGKAIIDGERRFFYECKPPYLYMGFEVASHEVDGIEQVYVNGNLTTFSSNGAVSSSNYLIGGVSPYLIMSFRNGAAGQTIDPILAADFPELPATFRQQGHACVVMKCYYGSSSTDHNNVWGGSQPQFLFLTRGMKVFDPRDPTQSQTVPATWKWSSNATLCQAHFLTYERGMKLPWAKVNLNSVKASASNDDMGVSLASGGVEMNYSLNGELNPNDAPANILQQMLTANLGDLIWSNGVYKFSSATQKQPVWTFTDDSARGDMEVRVTRDRNSILNKVSTLFAAPDRAYQTANGPILTNAAYQAIDGSEQSISLTLPFTASATMAQRIGKAAMEKSRFGKLITRRESVDAIRLEAGDIVNVQVESLPALGGVFKVNKIAFDHSTFEVNVECEEYNPAWTAWSVADEQPFTMSPSPLNGVK